MLRPLPGSLGSFLCLIFHIRCREAVLCVLRRGWVPRQRASEVSAGSPARGTAVPPDSPRSQLCSASHSPPPPRLFLKLNFLENRVAHSKDNWLHLGLGGVRHLGWSLPPLARWWKRVQEPHGPRQQGHLVRRATDRRGSKRELQRVSESVWMAGPGEAMRRPLRGDRGRRGECPGRGRGAVPGVPSILCPPLALSLPYDLGQRGACLLPVLASRLWVFRVGWVSPFSSQERQGGLGVRSRHKAGRP